jgi:hypothetical protein
MRVGSSLLMAKGRKSKDYIDGPRKQMTMTWKRTVMDRLAINKKSGAKPANIAQLAKSVGADKRGMYVTFDLSLPLDEQQMSSAYVDAICAELGIAPPLVESSSDAQLEQEIVIFRSIPAEERALILDPEIRKAFAAFAARKR